MSVFVFGDVEAFGPVPALGKMTEFGLVTWPTRQKFHGRIITTTPDPENPAKPLPVVVGEHHALKEIAIAKEAEHWLNAEVPDRKILVSDNPAFDFMWLADFFWRTLGYNPFGHSARRLADFYAGLTGDFDNSQKWKRLRVTKHDHNPVHDALGNLEAFDRMLKGER